MHHILALFNQYGYIVLLIALILELIAFPLPGEALMTYCGYLIYENKMNWFISVMIATLGVCIGITISYHIGKVLEVDFFEKHGHYVHMDKKRLDKISLWFERYGNKLLIVAYFIPGVRHVTGYFSGITKVNYKKFAMNAYLGAFIWTTTFISLGKVLGTNWNKYHYPIKKYFFIGSVITTLIIILIYLYKTYKETIYNKILLLINNSLNIYHSLRRIKVTVIGIAITFLVFLTLVIGVVEDYLSHEFYEFDKITKYIVMRSFDEAWNGLMKSLRNISNIYVLIIITTITIIWILVKGINSAREIKFIILCFSGAEVISNILKTIFHRLGPSGELYTFPSGETFMTVVTYGLLTYIVVKYSKSTWYNSLIITICLCICFLVGLSMIYLDLQYPSDILAGYEFGVAWFSLCIILLEIYNIFPRINNNKPS